MGTALELKRRPPQADVQLLEKETQGRFKPVGDNALH
jgi:hypothetical protein